MKKEMKEEVTGNVKKPKKAKTIIIVTVVGVVVIGLAAAIGNAVKSMSAEMQAAMEDMMGEDTYVVEKQDIKQEITTSGVVVGLEKKAYVSPVTAKVEDICVEVGQTVKKGDILLTYDATGLGTDLEKVKIQAQSERAAGNQQYEAANEAAGKASEARQNAAKLEEEIASLEDEISELSDKVADYEAKIKEAEEAALQSTVVETVPQTTQEGEEVTTQQATEAPAKKKTTVNESAYKKTVEKLQEKQELLAEKQAELATQESIVAANEDVKVSDSAKAQINAANQLSDLSVNEAQKNLDAAEAGITATASGIVESIEAVKGAYASETQTLMTIIDAGKIGVTFSISKNDLGSIAKGQKARVVISGKEYDGTVDFVSRVATVDMADTTAEGSIKGRIVLDEPDEDIFIGISAKVYIFVGESSQVLGVPYEALNTDIDGDFVYVVNKENLIERKDVTVGIYSDEYYEVLDGLEEGDKVIRNVTSDMKPGDAYVGNAATAGMMVE